MQNNQNDNITYYQTKYGNIALPKNEKYFIDIFNKGEYWDEKQITHNLTLIDKNKNVLEFGSHVGTHTIPYALHLEKGSIVYSFEPQNYLYQILQQNIKNNNLQEKIVSKNAALFYYNGIINMHDSILEGNVLQKQETFYNYGGLTIGKGGESTNCFKIDDLQLENIGFIHSDAQGSESIIFWGARETISNYKPIILYENTNYEIDNTPKKNIYLNIIKENYIISDEIVNFDIALFCMQELGYRTILEGYNTYLIP